MIIETKTKLRANNGDYKGEIIAIGECIRFCPEHESLWTDAELAEVCELMSKLQPLTEDDE